MKISILSLTIFCCGSAAVSCNDDQPARKPEAQPHDEYFISTSEQSKKRVSELHLDEKTFDASYLLDAKRLRVRSDDGDDEINFQPDPRLEWIIDIDTHGQVVSKGRLWDVFGLEWRKKHPGCDLYGYSAKDKEWTYVVASDAPETFSKFFLGWSYRDIVEQGVVIDKNAVPHYIQEIDQQAKLLGVPTKVSSRASGNEVISRYAKLKQLIQQPENDITLVLKANRPYEIRKAWQTLTNLGLEWGDGDLFHWLQPNGDDSYFTVSTSTEPGYFLPEQAAENKCQIADLVFEFSVPRNEDPENVLAIMLNCVEYCRKELGGAIVDQNGKPLDARQLNERIKKTVAELKRNGIELGSPEALDVFN